MPKSANTDYIPDSDDDVQTYPMQIVMSMQEFAYLSRVELKKMNHTMIKIKDHFVQRESERVSLESSLLNLQTRMEALHEASARRFEERMNTMEAHFFSALVEIKKAVNDGEYL